jgi:hypothetical protein
VYRKGWSTRVCAQEGLLWDGCCFNHRECSGIVIIQGRGVYECLLEQGVRGSLEWGHKMVHSRFFLPGAIDRNSPRWNDSPERIAVSNTNLRFSCVNAEQVKKPAQSFSDLE